MDRDTFYYDGGCPLCSAEINKLAKLSSGRLELKDIHELSEGGFIRDRALLLSRLPMKTAVDDFTSFRFLGEIPAQGLDDEIAGRG